jgi:hypothetical protein
VGVALWKCAVVVSNWPVRVSVGYLFRLLAAASARVVVELVSPDAARPSFRCWWAFSGNKIGIWHLSWSRVLLAARLASSRPIAFGLSPHRHSCECVCVFCLFVCPASTRRRIFTKIGAGFARLNRLACLPSGRWRPPFNKCTKVITMMMMAMSVCSQRRARGRQGWLLLSAAGGSQCVGVLVCQKGPAEQERAIRDGACAF